MTCSSLSGEFQEETNKYNKALHDSLQHYLAVYNKDKKYGMIFAKQGDNVLYADKAYDITNEVVAGLNKAYKSKLKKHTYLKRRVTLVFIYKALSPVSGIFI